MTTKQWQLDLVGVGVGVVVVVTLQFLLWARFVSRRFLRSFREVVLGLLPALHEEIVVMWLVPG